jgi:hypothetical protein
MDGGRLVHLSLHPAQVGYLRGSIANILSGIEADLASHPDDPGVDERRAERNAYRRLDEALAQGGFAKLDEDARKLVSRWLAANDLAEDFGRILFEHQTLTSLRDQIEAEL